MQKDYLPESCPVATGITLYGDLSEFAGIVGSMDTMQLSAVKREMVVFLGNPVAMQKRSIISLELQYLLKITF